MNPVVHFEMPFDNRDRMAKFYEKAFILQRALETGQQLSAATPVPAGRNIRR